MTAHLRGLDGQPIPSAVGTSEQKTDASWPRREDARLLTGSGRFIADLALDGQLHGVFVRSTHAHARIRTIDRSSALRVDGVRAILTAAEVDADRLGGIPWEVCPPQPIGSPPVEPGDPRIAPPQTLLARDRVRYVGEPVALVVAESLAVAQEAAEHVAIDYEPLAAVVEARSAMMDGAPRLHDQFPDNVCFAYAEGDPDGVEEAFRSACTIVELDTANQRLVAAPIEPRGYLGAWDAATNRWTLFAAAGKPHPLRDTLAQFVFRVPRSCIRVVVGDVGGGFGAKNVLYAEAALVLWAARRLGSPVRWIADRSETFMSDMQGRDHWSRAVMAFDRNGSILAIRVKTVVNLGAWLGPRGVVPAISGAKILSGVYRIANGRIEITAAFSNTVPTCPYRGAGSPEIIFVIERLIDLAARRLGIGPDEMRRRNLIAAAQIPYKALGGLTYDFCNFPMVLDRALELSRWAAFADRRKASAAGGMRRGIGIAFGIEAFGTSYGESAELRLTGDGLLEILIGTQSSGQGHETVYAAIAAARLGISADRVSIVQGDTDRIARGNGTGASRSLTIGGSAVVGACDRLVEVGRELAADRLEAAAVYITYANGCYRVVGTDRMVSLAAIAVDADGLSAEYSFGAKGFNFPYGCHIAEVEVDDETGRVRLLDYTIVHDSGRIINESIVRGQLHGGTVQGIGQALVERCVYDPDTGQLLSATLMDYALPRAHDVSLLQLEFYDRETDANPLGSKAVGEAGTVPAPAAVINAIVDALKPLGVKHIEMPATPERVWRAIALAQGSPGDDSGD
jgi:carbon-monoxide dehydrogenase large subunit